MQYWRNAEELEPSMMTSGFQSPDQCTLEEFCGIYIVGLEMSSFRMGLHAGHREMAIEGGLPVKLVNKITYDKKAGSYFLPCEIHKKIEEGGLDHNYFAESYTCGGDDLILSVLHLAPLYVGMTTRPFEQRIKEHHIIWPLVKWPWIGIRCWPFPIGTPKEYLMELEAVLINKFNPPLNKVRPTVCWGNDKTLFLPAVE